MNTKYKILILSVLFVLILISVYLFKTQSNKEFELKVNQDQAISNNFKLDHIDSDLIVTDKVNNKIYIISDSTVRRTIFPVGKIIDTNITEHVLQILTENRSNWKLSTYNVTTSELSLKSEQSLDLIPLLSKSDPTFSITNNELIVSGVIAFRIDSDLDKNINKFVETAAIDLTAPLEDEARDISKLNFVKSDKCYTVLDPEKTTIKKINLSKCLQNNTDRIVIIPDTISPNRTFLTEDEYYQLDRRGFDIFDHILDYNSTDQLITYSTKYFEPFHTSLVHIDQAGNIVSSSGYSGTETLLDAVLIDNKAFKLIYLEGKVSIEKK